MDTSSREVAKNAGLLRKDSLRAQIRSFAGVGQITRGRHLRSCEIAKLEQQDAELIGDAQATLNSCAEVEIELQSRRLEQARGELLHHLLAADSQQSAAGDYAVTQQPLLPAEQPP